MSLNSGLSDSFRSGGIIRFPNRQPFQPMKYSLVLLLLCGCAAPKTGAPPCPPMPPRPPVALFKPILTDPNPPAGLPPRERIVPWIYPAGIVPNMYCWTVQTSSNMVDWAEYPCATDPCTAYATNPCAFFRLSGVAWFPN